MIYFKVALYMRLSDEDDNLAAYEESNSISHQRKKADRETGCCHKYRTGFAISSLIQIRLLPRRRIWSY